MKTKTQNTATLGLFAAVIVVLQLMSYFIKIGTFNLSLVLIPVVLGAHLYGPKTGAVLGGIFGVVVTVCCFAGLDGGGYILIGVNPYLTSLVCIIKGVAAGFFAGLTSKALKAKSSYAAIMVSAIVAPVTNTGIFVCGMLLFFKETLAAWAGGSDIFTYVVIGLVGVNFVIEMLVNVVLAPSLLRVGKALNIK